MLLIIENKSKFIKDFYKFLDEKKIKYKIKGGNEILKKKDLKGAKGIILSGGPTIFADPFNVNEIAANLMVITLAKVPILGICLGHEAIGIVYGTKISKKTSRREGLEKIYIKKQDPIFNGLSKEFSIQTHHFDYMLDVPEEFELLASSEGCEIEVIKHKSKPIYGFQSHPEAFISGEDGKNIMINFLKICDLFI